MKTTTGVITAELNDTYDYIIVGGGTAGSVLAARLSEEGNSTVLLLEAGGDYTENSIYHIPSAIGMFEHSDADWQFLTEPQEHSLKGMNDRRSYWAAGRVLGGGSVLNYLLYTRGLAADYNSWAEMGCDGWDFDSVLPYFLKSEDILASDLKNSEFHGKGGPIGVSDGKISDLHEYFIKAGIEAGFEHKDYNDMVGESVSSMLITTRKGMRSSTGLEYLGRINGRNNLHVAVNSFVTKLRLVNKKAKGVYVIRDGRKRLVTARREVVMSAGAINTPAILMHSGIGSKHHLEKVGIKAIVDLPVGQNLQNHFFALMKTTINQSLGITMENSRNWKTMLQYYLLNTGYMSSPGAEAMLFACSKKSPNKSCAPDLQILFFSTKYSFNMMGHREDIFKQLVGDNEGTDGLFLVVMGLNPKSRGTINITSSDPFDHPTIQPNYLSEEEDVNAILAGIRIGEKLLETKILRSIGASVEGMRFEFCSEHDFRSDSYWKCVIRQIGSTSFHASGTCKMGKESDSSTVVDPFLRVKGIKGLRVVDASVMPTLVSGNTNAPVVMIAEKAADMIRGKKPLKEN